MHHNNLLCIAHICKSRIVSANRVTQLRKLGHLKAPSNSWLWSHVNAVQLKGQVNNRLVFQEYQGRHFLLGKRQDVSTVLLSIFVEEVDSEFYVPVARRESIAHVRLQFFCKKKYSQTLHEFDSIGNSVPAVAFPHRKVNVRIEYLAVFCIFPWIRDILLAYSRRAFRDSAILKIGVSLARLEHLVGGLGRPIPNRGVLRKIC